jgi:hypothetical protein
MPWYVVGYSALLVGLGVYTHFGNRRAGRTRSYLAIDAAVNLLWVCFVIAYVHPELVRPVGGLIWLPFFLGLGWTALDVRRELAALKRERPASYDPELSPELNRMVDVGVEAAALVTGLLIGGPAIIAGLLVSLRALR